MFSQFLSFLLSTWGGGPGICTIWLISQGMSTFLLRTPPSPRAWALFCLPARGMQSMFELPFCIFAVYFYPIPAHGKTLNIFLTITRYIYNLILPIIRIIVYYSVPVVNPVIHYMPLPGEWGPFHCSGKSRCMEWELESSIPEGISTWPGLLNITALNRVSIVTAFTVGFSHGLVLQQLHFVKYNLQYNW